MHGEQNIRIIIKEDFMH